MIGGESMKQRQILASALCVLSLAACNKKPEEVTDPGTNNGSSDHCGTYNGSPGGARDVF